jgi:hypothetical protein
MKRSALVPPLVQTAILMATWLLAALPRNAGASMQRGVTLYEDSGFRGRYETFLGDDPLLNDNNIGQDSVSSIRVAPGCEVTVYEHPYYEGRSATLREDQPDLRYTQVGSDAVSSLRVRCGGGGWDRPDLQPGPGAGFDPGPRAEFDPGPRAEFDPRGGVTLYGDRDFRGRQETFVQDDSSLRDNLIGQDRASSVRVAPGCWARLYEDTGFRGRYVDLSYDVPDLRASALGTDHVSSLRVSCAAGWQGDFNDLGQRGRVTLYADRDFRGRSESFLDDDPSLDDNPIGQDAASSVRVGPGCRVRLFEDYGFRGRYVDLSQDSRDLSYTPLGGDHASSLQVACDPGRPDYMQGPGPYRGVTLFQDSGFRGSREVFVYDDASLSDNHIDQDTVSSVRVDSGCQVRLFEDTGFRGRYVDAARDIPDLRYTAIGSDSVSSLRVRCFRPNWSR